jgi:hypothetical protein
MYKITKTKEMIKRVKAVKKLLDGYEINGLNSALLPIVRDNTVVSAFIKKKVVVKVDGVWHFNKKFKTNTVNVEKLFEYARDLKRKMVQEAPRNKSTQVKTTKKNTPKTEPISKEELKGIKVTEENSDSAMADVLQEFMEHLIGTRTDLTSFKSAMFDFSGDMRDLKKRMLSQEKNIGDLAKKMDEFIKSQSTPELVAKAA